MQSANGRYVLVFSKNKLALYDTQDNSTKKWGSNTEGKDGYAVNIAFYDKNRNNKLVMENENGKIVQQRNIGKATKLKVSNKGTIQPFAGNKKIAENVNLNKATNTAQSIYRKNLKLPKHKTLKIPKSPHKEENESNSTSFSALYDVWLCDQQYLVYMI